jgi:hypothetical protein
MLSGCKIYKPKAAFNKATFFARRLDLSFKTKLKVKGRKTGFIQHCSSLKPIVLSPLM